MKRIQRLLLTMLMLVLVALAVTSCSKTPNTEETKAGAGIDTGASTDTGKTDTQTKTEEDSDRPAAMDFTLTNVEGEEVTLSDLVGKVVILNFFATWCPPCKQELPGFMKTIEQYKDNQELVFLFVDIGEKKEEVVSFLQNNSYATMVPLLDISGEVSNNYKVEGIPTTFLIDKKGKIAKAHVGFMEERQLKSLIEEELK